MTRRLKLWLLLSALGLSLSLVAGLMSMSLEGADPSYLTNADTEAVHPASKKDAPEELPPTPKLAAKGTLNPGPAQLPRITAPQGAKDAKPAAGPKKKRRAAKRGSAIEDQLAQLATRDKSANTPVNGLLDGARFGDAMNEVIEPEETERVAMEWALQQQEAAPSPEVDLPMADEAGADGEEPDAPETGSSTSGERADFLPRSFYFENTYLAGDAALAWRLKRLNAALPPARRPYTHAAIAEQVYDPPAREALGLNVSLDRPSFSEPGRVFLQVALRGSERYGWRRPPLEIVLVTDTPDEALVAATYEALRRHLGAQDHLAILPAGAEPSMPMTAGDQLPRMLPAGSTSARSTPGQLPRSLTVAGEMLSGEAHRRHRVPGSRMVFILSERLSPNAVARASAAVHVLTLGGVITSVFEEPTAAGPQGWALAAAGHGHAHLVRAAEEAPEVVAAEFEAASRVVARLARLNVTLAPDVQIVRVVGSRPLEAPEVEAVKAREVQIDKILSETVGVKADRGDDDDGVQTVIPYFLGGDTHVVLFELWVEQAGPVADVSIKYKDLIRSTNATAQASASLTARPRTLTPDHQLVRHNLTRAEVALGLLDAAQQVKRAGLNRSALPMVEALLGDRSEAPLLASARRLLVGEHQPELVASALEVAALRRLSHRGGVRR